MLANISPTSIEALAFSSTISVSILWKFFVQCSNVELIISAQTFQVNHLQVVFCHIWPTSSVTPGI